MTTKNLQKKDSMAALLDKRGSSIKPLKFKDMVEGTVISKGAGGLVLDIGYKSEGMVPETEVEEDTLKDIEVGDKVTAQVLTSEDRRGYILLSLKQGEGEQDWEGIANHFKNEGVVEVTVLGEAKGGVLVSFGSLRGFIPYSQMTLKERSLKGKELKGKKLSVKIIEFNRDADRLVFSQKQALSKEDLAKESESLEKIKVGDVYEGEITSITPFGVFVRLGEGGLEGLVHVSQLDWKKTDDPSKEFKVGDKLKVKVIEIDEGGQRIALSRRALLENPWSGIVKKYAVGKKVKGKVTKIVDFGAFVQLEEGIEGLIHFTEATGPLASGEEVEVRVIETDPKTQKIALSLKAVGAGWK